MFKGVAVHQWSRSLS